MRFGTRLAKVLLAPALAIGLAHAPACAFAAQAQEQVQPITAGSIEAASVSSAPADAAATELHGKEKIDSNGTYRLADDATGTIVVGEGVSAELVGQGIDGKPYVNLEVVIQDGASATLRDVWIQHMSSSVPAIDFEGAGTLLVEGTNIVERPGGYTDFATIHVGPDAQATLGGTGALYGCKSTEGAFIGANKDEASGAITFTGGSWFVKGTKLSAIVGTNSAGGGDIRIQGGSLYLKTVSKGAAIGASNTGSAPDVYLEGGMVQVLSDFSGSAIGSGGSRAGAGALHVTGGSLMVMAGMNTYASEDAPNIWGVDASAHVGSVITDAPITAAHDTAQLVLPTAAYATQERVEVLVDGKPFYAGAPYYAYIANEAKSPVGAHDAMANWLLNSEASRPSGYGGCYPNADGNANAGDRALYLQLAKCNHVVSVGSDVFDAVWDVNAQAFELRAHREQDDSSQGQGQGQGSEGQGGQGQDDSRSPSTPGASGQPAQPATPVAPAQPGASAGKSDSSDSAQDADSASKPVAKSAAPTVSKAKRANTMTVKAKVVTVKFSKLKKKAQSVKAAKAFSVKKAKGRVTYRVVKYDKKAKKKIAVSKSGKVTVKKGLKKGTYKLKVKVTAAGNAGYKAKSKTVTLKVRVR